MLSYLWRKRKEVEGADKTEKGVKLHCNQIKVIFQAPSQACALINITIDVLMMCKGGKCWGAWVSVFLHFCILVGQFSPAPFPRSLLNLCQSLILKEFRLTSSLLPFPYIPPSFPLARNTQLWTTHIPSLSIPYWIRPHQARSQLVAVSPWHPVSLLMIGWSWCLRLGLV